MLTRYLHGSFLEVFSFVSMGVGTSHEVDLGLWSHLSINGFARLTTSEVMVDNRIQSDSGQ